MKKTIIINICFISLVAFYFIFWLIDGILIDDFDGILLIIYGTAYLFGGILIAFQGIFFGIYCLFKRRPVLLFLSLVFIIGGILLTINNMLSDKLLTP